MVVCKRCQKESSDDAQFCVHCASRLKRVCAQCGTVNPQDSVYCANCGKTLFSDDQPTAQEPQKPPEPEAVLESREPRAVEGSGAFRSTHRSQPAAGMPNAQPFELNLCPRCNAINEPDSAFCYKCGLPLESARRASGLPLGMQQKVKLPYDNVKYPVRIRPAGFWIRVAAAIIDGLIIGLAVELPLSFFTEADEINFFDFLSVIIGALYHIMFISSMGATPGKYVLKMRIIRVNGERVDAARAFVRWICGFLSAVLLLIGYIMVAFREDKRALHDLIAGTQVVIISD
ncbi:MAG: hypothetical protein FJ317_03800 [SAR202 cluster bacterium]|nr:hypothetical protein [SAR202 cluster bacterium]